MFVAAGCRLGAPDRPAVEAPVALAEPIHRPAWLEAHLDRVGVVEDEDADVAALAITTTDAVAIDEVDEGLLEGDVVVEPVLAVTGTVVTYDIPMSDDPRVEHWVEFLTTRGRRSFERWLGRSTRYVPMFWRILEQYGLPKDTVFLSMIESGFSPRAYSWAHAAGAWQFMPFTARRYGLRVGFWVDERRDFERGTHAAARLLTVLYDRYGDWYLAWAAYNAGTGRMDKAIRRSRTEDFWRISRTWHIRRETRHYVPKLLAAAQIAKQPEKYGFTDVEYLPELEWEVLTVTVATDLGTLSDVCEVEEDRLALLNPELRCKVTPPGRRYPVRVPRQTADTCRTGLRALGSERMTFRYHLLDRRDTVESIAAKYKTTPDAISTFNGLGEIGLDAFEEIVVPVPIDVASELAVVEPRDRMYRPSAYGPDGAQVIVYTVRSGDSLWRIARRHRVSMRKLRLWNGLWKSSRLRIGQRLKIYKGGGTSPSHPRWRKRRL